MICSRYDKNVQSLCSGLLKNEKVIILPTDTVYGFSGIIEKTDSKIRKIKGRAETKPFIVLIAFPGDINEITDDEIPENLLNLWPGPLTIIVSDKKKPGNTVAVRCPGDEWLRKIIEELTGILNDESKLKGVIKDELRRMKKEYGVLRKTEISETIKEIKIDQTDLITKEDVIIVLTNDGYLKRVPIKSHNSADGETALKPGDYVICYKQTNTLNKLCVFTSRGNYLYLPIHEIPSCKWKDLGKHISNFVTISPDDKAVNAFIINENVTNPEVTMFTHEGMVKRTNLNDFIVSRYSKAYTAMKLKDTDEVVNVCITKPNVLIVTKTGYYLNYMASEIPLSGPKAAGVKGINLKDDTVISGICYSEKDEYIDIFTNQKTAKRVKLSELNMLSRAKRGTTLIKKVKSTNYEIIKAFSTNTKDIIGIKSKDDIYLVKNSDIPIMDKESTGSVILKQTISDVFISQELDIIKDEDIELPKIKKEEEKIQELTIDDFLNDFKL